MKTLHILRHAKSSWSDQGLPDRERGLNKRGKRDAPRMGDALSQHLLPQPITVSTARRAQLTLGGLCDSWPALAELEHSTDEALYTFSANELIKWLSDQDDDIQSLFIIGHNPGLTELANILVGEDWLDNLPTAGYLAFRLDIDHWWNVGEGCARLECKLFPRELQHKHSPAA